MNKVQMLIKYGRVSAKNIKEVSDLQDDLKAEYGLDAEAVSNSGDFGGWTVRVVR